MSDRQPLPSPDIDQLQQEEEPIQLPAVLVHPDGPWPVAVLPSRTGPAFVHPMNTKFVQVLGADPKRRRTTLLATVAWEYSRTGNMGSGVPWPANVPLVIEHCDEFYAKAGADADLSVITEVWAD